MIRCVNTSEALASCQRELKLIVCDYDGTLMDKRHTEKDLFRLVRRIARKRIHFGIITARGVTAINTLQQLFNSIKRDVPFIRFFLGLGNGAALYEITRDDMISIYKHEFSTRHMSLLVEIWQKTWSGCGFMQSELSQEGIDALRNLLQKDWKIITYDMLALAKSFDGMIFLEPLKMTFVLPKDRKKHIACIQKLEEELSQLSHRYEFPSAQIIRGDETFGHITHAFMIDSKFYALQQIMNILSLQKHNVAVFGDMPEDNDKGMLRDSCLPYTFTNSFSPVSPPYQLAIYNNDPVETVYETLRMLIS